MIAHVSVFLIRVHGTKLDGDGFVAWVSQKAGLKEKAYMLPFYKGSTIRETEYGRQGRCEGQQESVLLSWPLLDTQPRGTIFQEAHEQLRFRTFPPGGGWEMQLPALPFIATPQTLGAERCHRLQCS